MLPFVLVTSLFFLWGFAHAILDVLNKHFQELLDITRTRSAMLQVLFYLGYFVMAIPAGLFINKYGYRKGVVLGLLLYGIGSLLFIPGEHWMSFDFFLFSLFVIACGICRGAGDVRFSLLVSVIGMWGLRIGLVYIATRPLQMGVVGVWIAIAVDCFIRSVLCIWRLRSGKWKNHTA